MDQISARRGCPGALASSAGGGAAAAAAPDRHDAFWLVQTLATFLAHGDPAAITTLGPAGPSTYPLVPVALLAARLVGMLYALVSQGRLRQAGKAVVAGVIALLAVARIYLGIDTPTGVLVASIIGVTIPLVTFRWLCPDEVFPVAYRRGRSAHLDVGGAAARLRSAAGGRAGQKG